MSQKVARILVVDDEPGLREMLSIFFKRASFDVTVAPGFTAAKDAIVNAPTPYALVVTDLMMPDGSGLDLLSFAKARNEGTEVIVMTAHSSVETALDAMKRGAYDFIQKPFANAELRALVEKALEKREIRMENVQLRARVEKRKAQIVGHSTAMKKVVELVERVANSRSTVLITGESGTGKERIARSIHDVSERSKNPFLVVNCGAFPEQLIESELFGHEKGSFTGAATRRPGIFREAEGGTVFLDEVGELPLPMQVKLLRVIQEKKVRGIGETQETSVDVRVLAATNRNVEDEVKTGKFRQDLYYRLNVIRVEVPPLRERREDVRDLLELFLDRASKEQGKEVRGLLPDALRALDAYDFPGNVRELENIVERAVTLASSPQIGLGDLPHEVAGAVADPTVKLLELGEDGCRLDEVLQEVERRLIVQALERSGGVRTGAARILGISFRSLRYRMHKLAMAEDDGDVGDDDTSPPSTPPRSSARIVTSPKIE